VTSVEVESGGALFFVDQLACGRVAHGETWAWDRLCLEIDLRLAGELILRERLDQSGESLRALAELAGSGPAACFANAVLVAPESSLGTAPWRDAISALHGEGLWVGVSNLRHGGWSLKFVASDAVKLRRVLRASRKILTPYFPRLACEPRKL